MNVYYEWDVETVEDGEVVDHHFCENYADAHKVCSDIMADTSGGQLAEIVLVRDHIYSRGWAYVKNGVLPEYFADALDEQLTKVPLRFVKEVAKLKHCK